MAEEKPGLFRRWFGGAKPAEPAPPAARDAGAPMPADLPPEVPAAAPPAPPTPAEALRQDTALGAALTAPDLPPPPPPAELGATAEALIGDESAAAFLKGVVADEQREAETALARSGGATTVAPHGDAGPALQVAPAFDRPAAPTVEAVPAATVAEPRPASAAAATTTDPARTVIAPEPASPPPPASPPEAQPAAAARPGWFQRLKVGLTRSSSALGDNIGAVFAKQYLDAAAIEQLEDVLIQADLGLETALAITERMAEGRYARASQAEVRSVLAAEVEKRLAPVAKPLVIDPARKPHVILVVGVNGTGKTTTLGKLSAKFRAEGRSVMLAAGDTFRAAAIDQLMVWGQRTGTPVLAREVGSDAAGLAFDALVAAREQRTDVLMIDTAGRLQNKAELMAELEKVVRVLKKQDPTAPHDVLLVLDATTGQNAMTQVEVFAKTAGVTGLVMTKLDGTARGGILVAIAAKYKLPVHFIGIGEAVDDLEPFSARDFARAIAGLD